MLSLLRDVEALVLPIACLACGEGPNGRRGAGESVLCDQCRYSLRSIQHPKCARCGQTLDHWEPSAPSPLRPSATCGFCHSWPTALTWAESATWYDDEARALVKSLKYGGWRVAAGPMAEVMRRRLRHRIERADLLVPIPLGRLRLRERGHNQAEELTKALTGGHGGPPLQGSPLQRLRETKSQTALHPSERRANVQGAFEASPLVKGKKIVLVDDVLTTGATLCAAAAALVAAGAAEVGAITFARAVKPV